jgi:hypothetical protein
VEEVNRPEEVDALIEAITTMLQSTGYPMDGKRVVWVMNDRVYRSGEVYRTVPMREWEASPYANVHKYSHDVAPANAALGANGCTDCHSPSSDFFFAQVVQYPFDEEAQPVTLAQYDLLGLSGPIVRLGAWRETYIKRLIHGLIILLTVAIAVVLSQLAVRGVLQGANVPRWVRFAPLFVGVYCLVAGSYLSLRGELLEYMAPLRLWLDNRHFLVAVPVLAVGVAALAWRLRRRQSVERKSGRLLIGGVERVLVTAILMMAVAGTLMLFKIPPLATLTRVSYTLFDLGLAAALVGSIAVASCEIAILSKSDKETR